MSEPIKVWDGRAPGSEGWTQQETSFIDPSGELRVRNVVVPTLTPFLPEPDVATGTGVIVAPGGGFFMLSMDNEGTDVAEWLCARGVAAFVLKYRLSDTGATQEEFMVHALETLLGARAGGEVAPDIRKLAVADAERAISLVRAGDFGIQPGRLGFMGFSAGGIVTTGVALGEERPDFVAPIYGALQNLTVPADAPPMFSMVCADDELAVDWCVDAFKAWRAAGRSAELHVYAQGGHGFGVRKLGLPVDTWIERFADWMSANEYVRSA